MSEVHSVANATVDYEISEAAALPRNLFDDAASVTTSAIRADLEALDEEADAASPDANFLLSTNAFIRKSTSSSGQRLKRGILNRRAMPSKNLALYDDQQRLLLVVENNPSVLEYATDELKADLDLVMRAVSQDGRALKHAAPHLQADRQVVLLAVHQNYTALAYASHQLRSDRTLLLAAVTCNGNALQYASPDLLDDIDLVMTAVQHNPEALQFASPELQHNTDLKRVAAQAIALTTLLTNPVSPSEAQKQKHIDVLRDRTCALALVEGKASWFAFLSPELRNDNEVVAIALRQDPSLLAHASLRLRLDEDFLRQTLSPTDLVVPRVQEILATAHREEMIERISQDDLQAVVQQRLIASMSTARTDYRPSKRTPQGRRKK